VKLSRRGFLAGATAALVQSTRRENAVHGQRRSNKKKKQETRTWTNWSGSVTTKPSDFHIPDTESELVDLVHRAAKDHQKIRVAASGHSFTPLCAVDDGMQLLLNRFSGIVSTDLVAKEATIWGGTNLFRLGQPLREAGLAMENLPDVDMQALAGAISTGTHGTGRGIRNLSNQAIGLRLVTASGDIVECSHDLEPEIFRAAQVSVGALGIITQVRMRLLPTYRLHEKTWRASFEECFENMGRLIRENRHFEFFWVSQSDMCLLKTLNPTDAQPDDLADRTGERIGHSDVIFPSVRSRRFNEIEFSLAEERGPECLIELRELLMKKYPEVSMPLEYRTLGADESYLSTANGRDTVTISAHRIASQPHEKFFGDVEAIYRNHGGRPHWGKIHTHTAGELEKLYPKWNAFQKIREQLDPDGRFLTPYMKKLLVA